MIEKIIVTKDFCKSPQAQAEVLKGNTNALIFCGCSERSSLQFNEENIEKLLEFLGIDKAMFETVNLREQCAFIHDDREGINAKAKDMLLMAYEKLKTNSEAFTEENIVRKALVIGGGVSGQRCAQGLADLGIDVTLVEEKPYLGGHPVRMPVLWQSESHPSVCTGDCVMPVVARDTLLRNVNVLTSSQIVDIVKENGNFKVKIRKKARKVDPEKCIGCGECAKVCPVEIPNEYNLGKTTRKAIDKDFRLAMPDVYDIVDSACTRCGECVNVCPTSAIDLSAEDEYVEDTFGAIVIATGFSGYDMKVFEELGYEHPNVVTLLEFERYWANGFFGEKPKDLAFVLCRKDSVGYCSRLCCLATVKYAKRLSMTHPDINVRVFHLSMRSCGRAFEEFRRDAVSAGVEFLQADVKKISGNGDGKLRIETDRGEYTADMVVLAEPLVPSQVRLTRILDVQTDPYGFPLEFQPRIINPMETHVERVFVIGGAKGFKDVQESIESGLGAAVRVYNALKGTEKKYFSVVDKEKCSKCGTCVSMCCPHGAITVEEDGTVNIDPALCRGCGLCYSACPSKAIKLTNLEDHQIIKMVESAFKHLPEGQPRILGFLCYWCSYGAGDLMGINGEKVPENFRSIRIRCSASLSLDVIAEILARDLADGILVAGCPENSCHHLWGNLQQERRIEMLNESIQLLGGTNKIVRWEFIGVPDWKKLADLIREMNEKLKSA